MNSAGLVSQVHTLRNVNIPPIPVWATGMASFKSIHYVQTQPQTLSMVAGWKDLCLATHCLAPHLTATSAQLVGTKQKRCEAHYKDMLGKWFTVSPNNNTPDQTPDKLHPCSVWDTYPPCSM